MNYKINYPPYTNKIRNTTDNNNMKRIKYISLLNDFLIDNPEIYVQRVLPQCILQEIYYYQNFQYKEI
jgi:hypothetical protein